MEITYNVSGVFEDKEDSFTLNNLTYAEACEKLPISLHGVLQLMLHRGDRFVFESTGEKTAWEVERL